LERKSTPAPGTCSPSAEVLFFLKEKKSAEFSFSQGKKSAEFKCSPVRLCLFRTTFQPWNSVFLLQYFSVSQISA
jgi:hypothetical protein